MLYHNKVESIRYYDSFHSMSTRLKLIMLIKGTKEGSKLIDHLVKKNLAFTCSYREKMFELTFPSQEEYSRAKEFLKIKGFEKALR